MNTRPAVSEEALEAFNNAPPHFKYFFELFQRLDASHVTALQEVTRIVVENTNAIKNLAARITTLENNQENEGRA